MLNSGNRLLSEARNFGGLGAAALQRMGALQSSTCFDCGHLALHRMCMHGKRAERLRR